MKTLADIPEEIRASYPSEVVRAFDAFSSDELRELRAFYYQEAGQLFFDSIGFIDKMNGSTFKPANIEKYKAICVLEDQIRQEIASGKTF